LSAETLREGGLTFELLSKRSSSTSIINNQLKRPRGLSITPQNVGLFNSGLEHRRHGVIKARDDAKKAIRESAPLA